MFISNNNCYHIYTNMNDILTKNKKTHTNKNNLFEYRRENVKI